MDTELSRQLKKLQTPQTDLFIEGKVRPSILFSSHDAANCNRETFYKIGVTGFQELKKINEDFSQYDEKLFGSQTKDLQRTILDKLSNEELSKEIEKFLLLLSPYLERQCALKALEWLIYRFYVNEMDIDSLIRCIFPYYETVLFVRILQVIHIKEETRWQWLLKSKKTGTPLTKSAVFTHWANYTAFRNFVATFLKKSMKVHKNSASSRLCISFCVTTTLGGIHASGKITEDHIASLVKSIKTGLSSKNAELMNGTYFIISHLALNSKLSDDFVKELFTLIITNNIEECKELRVMSLLLLCHHQKFDSFHNNIIQLLLNSSIPDGVAALALNKSTAPFFAPYFSGLFKYLLDGECDLLAEKKNKCLNSAVKILQITAFSSEDSFKIIRSILKVLETNYDVYKEATSWHIPLDVFLSNLEQSHPEGYDKAVTDISSLNQSANVSKMLEATVNWTGDDTMFRSLNHPEKAVRIAAVKAFKEKIINKQIINPMIVQSNIRSILMDDAPKVVLQGLLLNEELKKNIEFQELFEIFQIILNKCKNRGRKWDEVQVNVFTILTDCAMTEYQQSQINNILLVCLRLLLFPEGEVSRSSKVILKSSFAASHPILTSISTHLAPLLAEEKIKSVELMEQSWQVFPASILKFPEDQSAQFYATVMANLGSTCLFTHFMSMSILLLLVKGQKVNEALLMSHKLVEGCILSLNNYEVSVAKNSKKSNEWMKLITDNKVVPLHFIQECLEASINSFNALPIRVSGSNYWSFVSVKTEFGDDDSILLLFKVLKCIIYMESIKDSQETQSFLIKSIFKEKFENLKQKLYFLSQIWAWQEHMPHSDVIDKKMQIWSLGLGQALCSSAGAKISWALSTEQPVIPSLLTALCCGGHKIRKNVLKILKILSNIKTKQTHNFSSLLKFIINQEEELSVDCGHLPNVLATLQESDEKSINDMVAVIIHNSTPDHVRTSLLFALSHINTVNIVKNLLPLANNLLDKLMMPCKVISETMEDCSASMTLFYIFLKFCPETARVLDTNEGWQLFLKATNCSSEVMFVNDQKAAPQTLILDQVMDHKFFVSIKKSEVQAELWMILVNKIAVSENSREADQLRKALRKVSLDASLLIDQIKKLGLNFEAKTIKQVRARHQEMKNENGERELAWRKLCLILELVTVMDNLENPWLLVNPLCHCLKSSYSYEFSSSEMVQQKLLTTLHHLIDTSFELLEPSSYNCINLNIGVIIQCIQSLSPDTQRRALLVLSLGAKLYPDEVLTNMIAIFTFMGTSLLRRDDSYSFQVIHQTIESIIPTLITSNHSQKDVISKLAKVTQVFVDAFPDLPEHRRVPLFKQLATTLGVSDYLWVISTLLIYSHVTGTPNVQESKQKIPKKIAFSLILNGEFSIVDQVRNCSHILKYLKHLPISSAFDDNMNSFLNYKMKEEIIEWHNHSPKHFRHFIHAAISVLNQLVSTEVFTSSAYETIQETPESLQKLFQDILENTLSLLDTLSLMSKKNIDENVEKYLHTLQRKLIEFLDRANTILPPTLFISVIEQLMKSKEHLVRCRAIEMLCGKLQNNDYFDASHNKALLEFLNNLKSVAFINSEAVENRQTSLFAIQLLIRMLSSVIDQKQVSTLLIASSQVISQNAVHVKIVSQSILVAAESIMCLKAHALPHLAQILPALLQYLKIKDESPEEYLILTSLTALQKILETLPKFMGKFCVDLVEGICMLSAYNETKKFKESRINVRITSLCELLASSIEPRVLLPYLDQAFDQLCSKNILSLITFWSILQCLIETCDQSSLSQYQNNIVQIVTRSFSIRSSKALISEVDIVENKVSEVFTKMLLRLNENENANLFQNLLLWSKESSDFPYRLLTFYRFSKYLANTYKILFIKAKLANDLFIHACTMLERNNSLNYSDNIFGTGDKSEANTCLLIKYIIETLTTIFAYDTVSFTSPERFNMLLNPLVNQIENMIGTEDAFQERVMDQIKPCVIKLTVAAGDDSLWKGLNRQILLKVRNDDNPKIILAALEVFQGLVESLGEDYLQPLLGDIMPYITEVIESLDSGVEAKTREVFIKMEEILGDNLRAYLTS